MGRCVGKCRSFAEVVVMEVKQVVGARTRAKSMELAAVEDAGLTPQRRKADGAKAGEQQTPYLQLRSRSLVLTHRLTKSARNYKRGRRGTADRRRIMRYSGFSSCESVDKDALGISCASVPKLYKDHGSSMQHFDYCRDRDITASNNQNVYPAELDSTREGKSRKSTDQFTSPAASEIDEFFAAAEKSERQRFTARYNFDVVNEIPLQGRYEWAPIYP